jgi:hypothetical protein
MNRLLKELDMWGVEARTVDDVPVLPESCSRDTQPDDLHDRSRAGGNIGDINLTSVDFKEVVDTNGPESVGTL